MCESQLLIKVQYNWILLECKSLLDPEHVETTGEAVVPTERKEHAIAAA